MEGPFLMRLLFSLRRKTKHKNSLKLLWNLSFCCLLFLCFAQPTFAKYTRLESSKTATPDGEVIWNDFRRHLEIPYNEQREDIQKQIKFYQSHKHFFPVQHLLLFH